MVGGSRFEFCRICVPTCRVIVGMGGMLVIPATILGRNAGGLPNFSFERVRFYRYIPQVIGGVLV